MRVENVSRERISVIDLNDDRILGRLGSDKHSSLIGPFESYEENEVFFFFLVMWVPGRGP